MKNHGRILFAAVLFAVLAFMIWIVLSGTGGSALPASETQDVRVARVQKHEISSVVSAQGIVEEAERRDIFAVQPLKVEKVLVKKGDRVLAGERLLQYDISQLKYQYEELLLTKEIQEETLEKIKNLSTVRNTAPLEAAVRQAEDSVNAAWSQYDKLREEFDSANELYLKKKITKTDREKAALALTQADNAMKSAECSYETAKASLDEAAAANEQAEKSKAADIMIQTNNLKTIDLKIEESEKMMNDIEKSSISPISGVVTAVNTVEGGFATIQMPVVSIADDSILQIRAQIKEFDACLVKTGQKAEISCDTMESGTFLPGTVKEVSCIAEKDVNPTGTETFVDAVISIDKPTKLLIPGLSTTCKIVSAHKQSTVVISYAAIKENMDGSKTVFVVNGSDHLVSRPVILGISSESDVEVLDGLKEGDLIVTNWQPSFKAGDRARIIYN